MTRNRKLATFTALGLALAIITGYGVLHIPNVPTALLWPLAAAVVWAAARCVGLPLLRRPVTPNPEAPANVGPFDPQKVPPRFGSRRWARYLYHNGDISIEELVTFCASRPVIPNDPDNEL